MHTGQSLHDNCTLFELKFYTLVKCFISASVCYSYSVFKSFRSCQPKYPFCVMWERQQLSNHSHKTLIIWKSTMYFWWPQLVLCLGCHLAIFWMAFRHKVLEARILFILFLALLFSKVMLPSKWAHCACEDADILLHVGGFVWSRCPVGTLQKMERGEITSTKPDKCQFQK